VKDIKGQQWGGATSRRVGRKNKAWIPLDVLQRQLLSRRLMNIKIQELMEQNELLRHKVDVLQRRNKYLQDLPEDERIPLKSQGIQGLFKQPDLPANEDLVDDSLLGSEDAFVAQMQETALFQTLWGELKNTYQRKVQNHPERGERYKQVRQTTKELLAAWLTRIRRIHFKPLMIVRLSFFLYHVHCPASLWRVLSSLRLVLSATHTSKLLAVASSIPLAVRLNWPSHPHVAILGADNCSYSTSKCFISERDVTTSRHRDAKTSLQHCSLL
jgi:hypothetical protein